ncbi:MAG: glutamate--tRNA ligase family protein, partial [Pseudohongiellaceae bacterium]
SPYVLQEQSEFAKLNLNYTMMGKRNLRAMVEEGVVSGWDDPRMPTIAGMRRRGFTPASLRNFCESVGVSRSEGVVDLGMLEHAIGQTSRRIRRRGLSAGLRAAKSGCVVLMSLSVITLREAVVVRSCCFAAVQIWTLWVKSRKGGRLRG